MNKKIIKIIIVIITILHVKNVYAATGITCDMESVVDNNDTFLYTNCTSITISNPEYLDKLNDFKSLNEIVFNSINIDDISFINKYKIENLEFMYSKVNIDNINSNSIKSIFINNSQIENDNFAALKNLPNLERFSYLGYFNNINSIKSLSSLSNLKRIVLFNYGKYYDVKPLYELTNIKELILEEIYYTEEMVNHLKKYNISYNNINEYTEYSNSIKQVDDFYDSLELDNLTDLQKIIAISNAINNKMHYANKTEPRQSSFMDYFLAGYGVCSDYAMITSYFLNKAGFIAYNLTGDGYIDEYTGVFINHSWNVIYYNGKWYAIDNTWTDGKVITEEGVLNHEYPYFMVDPKDEVFYESNYHHPHTELYKYTDFKINIEFETNYEESINPVVISTGQKYQPKPLTRNGYKFDGWYLDNKFTQKYNSHDYINYDKIVLYAKWTKTKNILNPGTFTNKGIILLAIVAIGSISYIIKKKSFIN